MHRRENKGGEQTSYLMKALWMFGGALAGGILGYIIGRALNDAALYAGFGMMVGLGLAVDILAHIHKKREEEEEEE